MSGPADPKNGVRREIVDPAGWRLIVLSRRTCVACGEPGSNGHHVLAKGDGGDDVAENEVTLCGSGTARCHGAYHGNPYEVVVPDTFLVPGDEPRLAIARRDQAWVAWRIGQHLLAERPETIDYVVRKLGPIAGRWYLLSRYQIEIPSVVPGDIVLA